MISGGLVKRVSELYGIVDKLQALENEVEDVIEGYCESLGDQDIMELMDEVVRCKQD